MKREFGIFLTFLLVFSSVTGFTCSLPAEPVGAAVPDTSTFSGPWEMKYDGGKSYYWIPQGTKVTLKVVWDPYDHNGGNLNDKYVWVKDKAGLAEEPNTTRPNNKGYFPLSAMAAFFTVSGNRNSITEAFNNEVGGTPSNQFMADSAGLGPSALLTASFVKPGQSGAVDIAAGDKATGYPDSSQLCSPSGDDLNVEDAGSSEYLDKHVPNDRAAFSPKETTNESGSTRTIIKYVNGSAGMYMGDLNIALDPVEPKDFKAYIVDDAAPVHIDGPLPLLPSGSSAGLSDATGNFTVTFTTPTTGAANPEVRIKVSAPAAGFAISNLYWCWQETVETQTWTDANSDSIKQETEWASSAPPETKKCSVGLVVTVRKPGGGNGYTAFRVYDTKSPITSKFTMKNAGADPSALVCGEAIPQLDFTLEFIDSNPFADGSYTIPDEPAAFQSPTYLTNSLAAYYSYPIYDFKVKDNISWSAIPTIGSADDGKVGLMKFMSGGNGLTPTFQSYFYEPKWVWKRAVLSDLSAVQKTSTIKFDGKDAGGTYKVTGKIAFAEPTPWHFATEGSGKSESQSAHSKTYPTSVNPPEVEKLMKVFAVMKDSTNNACPGYDDVIAINQDQHLDSAGTPSDLSLKPADATELTTTYSGNPDISGDVNTFFGETLSPVPWQKVSHFKVNDDKAPEIQVFVFDTRNNLYHNFGTGAGGDAKFTGFAAKPDTSYAALLTGNTVPYSSTSDLGALQTGSVFDAFEPTLFDKFFNKSGTGAVSMLDTGNEKKTFICQRNTRLVFYIRAWDNINVYSGGKGQGVSKISYEIKDAQSPDTPPKLDDATYDIEDLFKNPAVWQFRYSNSDGTSYETAGKECSLTVKAKDFNDNERELKMFFAITDNDMTIRSLEEKRKRTY